MSNNPYNGHEDFSDGIGRGYTLVRNGVISSLPTNPEPEIPVEEPWPPAVILPVKYKVKNYYTEMAVVIHLENGSAIIDFGDGSEVREYTDIAEYTYPKVIGATVPPVPFIVTVTPTSRIPLLSTDIQELIDWGSSGSVKRFKFTHMKPILPEDIASWIRDTSYMFEGCMSLDETANLLTWNMSNVVNTSGMFFGILGFNQDLSTWHVDNVTNAESMFEGCNQFDRDLSSWNVSNITNMRRMFKDCVNLGTDFSGWDTTQVTNMSGMFERCYYLDSGLSDWDVSNVTDTSYMLSECHNFNDNLSKWNVSNVTDMSYMFNGCYDLFSPESSVGFWSLEKWDVSSVTNMECMFNGVHYGIASNISDWDVGNVTNMKEMFRDCFSMNHLTHWNTSKVTTMEGMFDGAFQFNSDISRWDVSNVTNMDRMFRGVQWLVTSLDKWCVENITEEPIDFMPNVKDKIPENSPKWGTCPTRKVN